MSPEPVTSDCPSGMPAKGGRPPGFGAVGVVGGGLSNVTPNTVGVADGLGDAVLVGGLVVDGLAVVGLAVDGPVADGLALGALVCVPLPPAGQAGAGAVVGAKA
jgi:hypothetical protein